MKQQMPQNMLYKLKAELDELDKNSIVVDGKQLRPSQCYRLDTDPAHILFNTNCPETLKQKLQAILLKYIPQNESRSQ